MQLSLRARFLPFRMQPTITSIRLKLARLDAVMQKIRDDFVEELDPQGWRFYRKRNLDPSQKISRHPIRAGQIEIGLPGVFKLIDSAMLEESADDAQDANVFA